METARPKRVSRDRKRKISERGFNLRHRLCFRNIQLWILYWVKANTGSFIRVK